MKDQLKKLIQERDLLLKKHKNVSFPTEKEIQNYIKKNNVELKRLNEVQKQIKELEWEMMSEIQKKEYLEEQQKIKEKHSED